jgi:hypothetical protein
MKVQQTAEGREAVIAFFLTLTLKTTAQRQPDGQETRRRETQIQQTRIGEKVSNGNQSKRTLHNH